MIDTINVIDITNLQNFDVSTMLSFPANPEGEREAVKVFKNWVREAAGRDVSHEEMGRYLDAGKYEVGDGVIILIRSYKGR